ncbi:MAG: phage tail sheath family protein [Rhodobacteraceae bacterium]|nr:phage tail sheath family protein [Paracoccaceae bacterium]
MGAPGVTVKEVNQLSLSVSAGPTAIPVFIGKFKRINELGSDGAFASNGSLLDEEACYRIENWLDFSSRFGESAETVVHYEPATNGKFKEGSNSTKKSKEKTAPATADVTHTPHLGSACVQHYFDNGGGPCYILPYNIYSTDVADLWAETIRKYPDISLLCHCENRSTSDYQYMCKALNPLLNSNQGYFLLADMPTHDFDPCTTQMQTAQYWPALETRYSPRPSDDYIYVTGVTGVTDGEPLSNPNIPADVYKTINDAIAGVLTPAKYLPAGPAMAGIYAKTDRERGVWKAPANVVINNVNALYYPDAAGYPAVTDQKPSTLDVTANEIVYQSGRGLVVWGARTMEDSEQWRYIPVRRLFNSAERDIKETMRSAVFQPNSQPTWESVRGAIANYLEQLWRKGGLMGDSAEQAFFVQVGKDITMTEADILQGRMIVKVGMAAVRPAEYIILQFTQDIGAV